MSLSLNMSLSLTTALAVQPWPLGVFNAKSTRISMQVTYNMKGVLHFISPLIRRTDIVSESIDEKFESDAKNSEKTLQELIESVHKQDEQETNQLIKLCEETKSDRNRRLSFYHFNMRAVGDDVTYETNSANEASIMLWKACVSLALIKLEIPENKIRITQNPSMGQFRPKDKPFKNYVNYVRQGLEHEINDFLVPLAGIVEAITIGDTRQITPLKPLPLSSIAKMLSGKCRFLKISERNSELSLKGVEDLIKHFHRLNTHVVLQMRATVEDMNIQIGEYRVKNEGDQIIIRNA